MFSRLSALSATLVIAVLTSACAPVEPLELEEPRIREPTPGRTTTAAYFTLRNNSGAAVTLVGAESSSASSIEMHTIVERDGRVGMRRVPDVTVDPGASVHFAPGGLHLMVFGVERLDEPFPIELIFADGKRLPAAFAKLSLVPGGTIPGGTTE